MLSVEQASSIGHEFLMDFLVVTIRAGIYRLWNEIQMIAKFLFLLYNIASHANRLKKVPELWVVKEFMSTVDWGYFLEVTSLCKLKACLGLNTGWAFLVVIAIYVLSNKCSKVLITKINLPSILRGRPTICNLHRENTDEKNGKINIFFSLLLGFLLAECLRFSRFALNIQLVDH